MGAVELGQDGVSDRGLVVGRVQRWKGPQILCKALQHLGRHAPAVDWYGRDMPWGAREDSTTSHLARVFPDLCNSKLFFHTPISPDEVARRQAGALFNLVPSTWDVFNFTAAESMASGRPTIISASAGASELIEDGVNGFLFTADDAEALASAIERVLSKSPVQLAQIGRNARETLHTAMNPHTIAAQRVAAYQAAINDFAMRRPESVGGSLGKICRPSDARIDEMAFLNNFPLRSLSKYLAARITRKVAWM
jgi:glycosyltransferase involved in cell wall biosynthesis